MDKKRKTLLLLSTQLFINLSYDEPFIFLLRIVNSHQLNTGFRKKTCHWKLATNLIENHIELNNPYFAS